MTKVKSIFSKHDIYIPIYDVTIRVVIDQWHAANLMYELGLSHQDMEALAWTVFDVDDQVISAYLLLKSEHFSAWSHELIHIISYICRTTGMKWDPRNDESIAYLSEYISNEIQKLKPK